MSTAHLTAPAVHEEGLSGTEDEGGHSDVQSADGADDDDIEVADSNDREPETMEERERFYQEVRNSRCCQT